MQQTAQTCYEYMVRATEALRPYEKTIATGYTMAFMSGIELLVQTENISSFKDPALIACIELASKGTGIPEEVVRQYAEMAVALNKPVHI